MVEVLIITSSHHVTFDNVSIPTVKDNIKLFKLICVGYDVSAYNWLKVYLSVRVQTVMADGFK